MTTWAENDCNYDLEREQLPWRTFLKGLLFLPIFQSGTFITKNHLVSLITTDE